MDNTSGQGKGAVVPDEVKGLSWGGFFWNWLWGLFNRVWLSLFVFIPVVGMIVPFVLLFKGREWAWQNKTWESVEHFNRVQRKWAIAALIFLGLGFAITLGAFLMGGLFDDSPGSSTQAGMSSPSATPVPASATRPPLAPPAVAPSAAKVEAAAPKPEAAVIAEAPRATVNAVATPALASTATVAAPAAPARVAAPNRAGEPAAESAPRVRRERLAQPLAVVASAPVETKVYTPKYNDLMTAVLRPDRQGVTELLDLGRWIDKPDATGVTPLLAAVRNRDTAMTELLIARGANINATAANGLTAMSIARANGDAVMTTLLQRSGAK